MTKLQIKTPQDQLKYIRLPLEMLDNKWVTSADVVIYAFMLNRYLFFKSIGKTYYENVDDIAKGCRMGTATVSRTIKKLQENGYIEISKIKVEVGCSNSYVVNDLHKINEVVQNIKTVYQNDSPTKPKPARYSDKFMDNSDSSDDLF